MDEIHLTGADHLRYGALAVRNAGNIAAAMSIGATSTTPSMKFKGRIPNEDALSARDAGRYARLVVADSHYGHQASTLLVSALHTASLDIAQASLEQVTPTTDGSETTVTSIWIDREDHHAHLSWFGDSLAVLLRRGSTPQILIDADHRFVRSDNFDWRNAAQARIAVTPGDLLVAFTDGVNECHYRQPATSIGLDDIQAIFDSTDDPSSFVKLLGETALAGVGGNPGGQDNIAIAALLV